MEVSSLFNNHLNDSEEEKGFSRDLVMHLTERLEAFPLPHLTPSEMEHLIVLIQTTLEVCSSLCSKQELTPGWLRLTNNGDPSTLTAFDT